MRARRRQLLALPCVALLALAASCGGPGSAAPHTHSSSSSHSSHKAHTGSKGSPATSAPTTSIPPTSGLATLKAATWTSLTVPGDVCPGRTAPVVLSHGKATIPTPPGVQIHTTDVQVAAGPRVFGDLYGSGQDVAAVNVWCAGANGSAASELENSWVLYTDANGSLQSIFTFTPQQPASSRKGVHVPYFDSGPGGIVIAHNRITVKELWYTPKDSTCCPTEHVTTVWHAHGSSFSSYTNF